MRLRAALAAAAAALALSACQTTNGGANYVKVGPGPKVEAAIAECKAISSKARHIVIGIGGPEAIVAGRIGTAVATGVRQTYVFEECMKAQGYGKAESDAAPAAGPPAPPANARRPEAAKGVKAKKTPAAR